MAQKKYDVFISYRRTSYDTANLIAVKLRHAGFRVFFDVDTLTGGKFNEQLLDVIANCKDFILILPENALDRCHETDDWIRKEVICALENNKNIVPVMLDRFVWPKEMPKGMEDLPNYQAVTAVGHEFFDMAVERLQTFLKSKPTKPFGKWMRAAGMVLGVIVILLGISYGIMHHIAEVNCSEIGAKLTSSMNVMELLGEDGQSMQEELANFYQSYEKARDDEEKADIENCLLQIVENNEKQLATYQRNYPAPSFENNDLENYILSYRNIKKEELDAFPVLYNSMLDDMKDINQSIKDMVKAHQYSHLERDLLSVKISYMAHTLNALYYGYLGSLSLLPQSARKAHFIAAKKWKIFPNGTPLDLTQEEYEQFQMQEYAICDEEMRRIEKAANYEEQRLEQMEEQMIDLERKAEKF